MKMKTIFSTILTSSIFVLGLNYATAQDSCSDILKDGIRDTYRSENSYSSNLARLLDYATMSYDEYKGSSGSGAEFSIPIDGVPFSFGGNSSRETFRKKQNQLRKLHWVSEMIDNQNSVFITTANKDVINAWRDCMKKTNGQFASIVSPIDYKNGVYTYSYHYTYYPGKAPKFKGFKGHENLILDDPQGYLNNGSPIRANVESIVNLRLKDPSKPAYLTVFTSIGDRIFYIPPYVNLVPEERGAIFTTKSLEIYYSFDRAKDSDFSEVEPMSGVLENASYTYDRFNNPNKAIRTKGKFIFTDKSNGHSVYNILRDGDFTINFWLKDQSAAADGKRNYSILYFTVPTNKPDLVRMNGLWFYKKRQNGAYSLIVKKGMKTKTNSAAIGQALKVFDNSIGKGDNKWHNYSIVYNSKSKLLKLYVDGKYIPRPGNDFVVNMRDYIFKGSKLEIGGTAYVADRDPFDGLIDEFKIYSRALTDREIKDIGEDI